MWHGHRRIRDRQVVRVLWSELVAGGEHPDEVDLVADNGYRSGLAVREPLVTPATAFPTRLYLYRKVGRPLVVLQLQRNHPVLNALTLKKSSSVAELIVSRFRL